MRIPNSITELYRDSHQLTAFVAAATGRISDHIGANRLEFFPEYTDHGITHLEQVLDTAIELVNERTLKLLTAEDAAVLSVAVALHDFGMHLTRDGFETLVSKTNQWSGISNFGDKPWNELWVEFLSEASRFDGRKLRALFGENYKPVRHPPSKDASWEDFDYLLVGEFLRRHHPRLAHDIANTGMPGKNGLWIQVCPKGNDLECFLSDIVGLVARSHGLDLRVCLSYLEFKYQNRVDPRRVHAPLLMVLLRIADYFQIQAARAPTARTDVLSFRSPLSDREWKVHQSVSDIHNTSGDPEAIVVTAAPPDVDTFLRIKAWIGDLQRELDTSWAVLGEVYGLQTHNHLSNLGLRIRRVKSNMDDADNFSKSVSYVPAKITFETANADLLKLLVGPLYGHDAKVGIRELLQNAVDSILEFDDLILQRPDLKDVQRNKVAADVDLHFQCDEDNNLLEISVTDRGVGMTLETVRNYFLRAGASFRRSDVWRSIHEDADGSSRVLRSGRFGVGALAAFLLGNEIEVTTRYAAAAPNEGLQFKARIDDEAIDIRRVTCPVGTVIKVKIPEALRGERARILPYRSQDYVDHSHPSGHYFGRYPAVTRTVNSKSFHIREEDLFPSESDAKYRSWTRFMSGRDVVFWTFKSAPSFSCNAIIVSSAPYSQQYNSHELANIIRIPNICAYDRNGNIPLNLQRNSVSVHQLGFKDDLIRSIVDDLIAYALVNGPSTAEDYWLDGTYEGFHRTSNTYFLFPREAGWLITRSGFVLNDIGLVNVLSPRRAVISIGGPAGYVGWGARVSTSLTDKEFAISVLPEIMSSGGNRKKGIVHDAILGAPRKEGIVYGVRHVFVPDVALEMVEAQSPGRSLRRALSTLKPVEGHSNWKQANFRAVVPKSLSTAICSTNIHQFDPTLFLIADIERAELAGKSSVIADRWLEVLQTPIIPFDLETRKELVEVAMKKIPSYLESHYGALEKRRKVQNAKKIPTDQGN